ncbi:MAG: dTMP kinase [Aerococcaceae bacterium]|nr:dTMP kinase [Aerococcaceae bacterium]
MKKGTFISIEGPDGAGKSSVIQQLAEQLRHTYGYEVLTTREPGGNRIAEQIRNVILDVDNVEMDSRTEALLYAAARRQHLVQKVLPALEAGQFVLCDRFVDSSLAYQGIARGIDTDLIWQINQFAIEGYLPDLTLLIDVPAEVGLARIHAARGERQFDRLDQEDLAFHQTVRDAFLQMEKTQDRIVRVDGTLSLPEVVAACIEQLKAKHII